MRRSGRLLKIAALSLWLLGSLSTPGLGAPRTATSEVAVDRLAIQLLPHYAIFSGLSQAISGIGMGVAVPYGLSANWGIEGRVAQTFASKPAFSALSTELDLAAVYALTGSLVRVSETTSIEGEKVLVSRDFAPGGLRARASVNQTIFNSAGSLGSFTGIGLGFGYEWARANSSAWVFGLNWSQLKNSQRTVDALHFYAGIAIWP